MDVQAEQKEGEAGKDDNSDDDDDDGILEFTMECDAASDEESSIEEEETCGECKEGSPSEKKIWYFKLKHLIVHVRDASFGLIMVLGTYIALNKMMMQFCGCSSETHQMKNKQIEEGCKFFTLASVEGYVINFTPDGCTTENSQQQEYETCSTMGNIESMILHVISIIDMLCDRQNEWDHQNEMLRTTGINADTPMDMFCLAIDNYFTVPKVIATLCEMNIRVVGTSCFRKAWPPKEL
eukprot:1179855-Ditylum_brightwellii.AAC.1